MVNPASNNIYTQQSSALISTSKIEGTAFDVYNEQKFSEFVTESYIESCLFFIRDGHMRKMGYKENPSLLQSGIFYANDHYLAMKAVLPALKLQEENAKKEYSKLLGQMVENNDNASIRSLTTAAQENCTKVCKQYKELKELFDKLHTEGCYFHGYQNPKYFDLIKSSERMTGYEISEFTIKKGFSASELVDAFNNGLTFTDCLVTIDVAARFNALRHIWGDEKFNVVFDPDSKTPISYSKNINRNLLNIFMRMLPAEKNRSVSGQRKIVRGQMCYVQNAQYYNYKHYNGSDQAINLICLNEEPGKQQFTGFGLSSEGISEEKVNELLLQSYNSTPINLEIVPAKYHSALAYDDLKSKMAPSKLDKITYEKTGGGSFTPYPTAFNYSRIWEVKQTPIEKVRALVDTWS